MPVIRIRLICIFLIPVVLFMCCKCTLNNMKFYNVVDNYKYLPLNINFTINGSSVIGGVSTFWNSTGLSYVSHNFKLYLIYNKISFLFNFVEHPNATYEF